MTPETVTHVTHVTHVTRADYTDGIWLRLEREQPIGAGDGDPEEVERVAAARLPVFSESLLLRVGERCGFSLFILS